MRAVSCVRWALSTLVIVALLIHDMDLFGVAAVLAALHAFDR